MPQDRLLEFANSLCSQALSTAEMWSVVRTYLLRLVPLPRSSADSRDEDGPFAGRGHRSVNVGQEARFALAEFKFGAAGAAQQCTTVGAQGDSGTARRRFRLLAGKREPVQAEFRCRDSCTTAPGSPGP